MPASGGYDSNYNCFCYYSLLLVAIALSLLFDFRIGFTILSN